MKPLTPLECLRREPLRQVAVRKLHRFAQEKGQAKMSKALILVADSGVMRSIDRHFSKRRDFGAYLAQHGVRITHQGRSITVSDSVGTFTFVDDKYGSGFEFLLGHLVEEGHISRPHPLPLDMVPNSISKGMTEGGFEITPHGARQYLVSLHNAAEYPNTLPYRLLGGDFKQLRPLNLVRKADTSEIKSVRLTTQSPKKHLRAVIVELESTRDVVEFSRLARLGLAVVRESGDYQTICSLSSRKLARNLFGAVFEGDPVEEAYLLGKAKGRTNIEIFSALCRRVDLLV